MLSAAQKNDIMNLELRLDRNLIGYIIYILWAVMFGTHIDYTNYNVYK